MKSGNMLLIEDNPDDVDLVTYAFRKAGIANPLASVGDGDAAIAYIDGAAPYADRTRHPLPALFLLDLKLPRRSGFDVLAHIRSLPKTLHTPVVVLTSSGLDEDIRRAYELHANSYLLKPVKPEDLLDMVRTLSHYWFNLNQTIGSI